MNIVYHYIMTDEQCIQLQKGGCGLGVGDLIFIRKMGKVNGCGKVNFMRVFEGMGWMERGLVRLRKPVLF